VWQDGLLHGAAGMFPSETVYVFALDPETGEEVWKTPQDDLPGQGYLLASSTRLYTPSGRDNPIVLDRENGKRLRVVEGQGGTYALLTGDQIVFGPGKTGELGLVEHGQQDQLATFAGNHMIVTPTMSYLHSDKEISGLDRPRYLEHSRVKKSLLLKQREHREALKKLGAEGEKQKIASHNEEIAKINTRLQEVAQDLQACILYKQPCQHPISLILVGDHLIAGGEGEVAAYTADGGELVWSQRVDGDVYGLAVSGGRLYVSTDTGRIYCFAEKSL
jgi:outer membrane protein assembly factor BamB